MSWKVVFAGGKSSRAALEEVGLVISAYDELSAYISNVGFVDPV